MVASALVVMDKKNRNSVVFFLVLTFAISSIFYRRSFSGASLSTVVPFLMWTPGLCAIVTKIVFDRTIAGLGWRLGPSRYLSALYRAAGFAWAGIASG